MTETRIKISIGSISFEAEGDQKWVGEQLDKLYVKAKELAAIGPAPSVPSVEGGDGHHPMKPDADIAGKTLATFLKEKNATSKQVLKFLATAVWLESKGKNRMTTADVTKALRDSNQSKLNNPADCLGQNVKKGYCEKEGNQFFVTSEGKESL